MLLLLGIRSGMIHIVLLSKAKVPLRRRRRQWRLGIMRRRSSFNLAILRPQHPTPHAPSLFFHEVSAIKIFHHGTQNGLQNSLGAQ